MPLAYGPELTERQSLWLHGPTSSGILEPYVVYASGSWPEAVVGGEYTGDGLYDVVLSTSFDWDPANDQQVQLFGQSATGTLTRTQRLAAGTNPTALAQGDLNHDDLGDVAAANQGDDTLGVLVQSLGGGLQPMVSYAAGDGPDGVAVGDFNGDLRDDVAVSHAVSQYVAVYYQQADGTLTEPAHLGVSSAGFNDLAAGDLNGDGYDDLVLLRGAGHASFQVAVFYQQNRALGAPVFRSAEDGGFLAHGLAVGDVTGDGRDDVIVTAGGNVPLAYLNVFVQEADGSLAVAPVTYPAYHLPEAVEVGDVNHDGWNDVVNVHAAWMSLSVYTQTVSGALSPYERYPLPYTDYYRPAGLDLGDVSGDGSLDVVIASHSSLPDENGVVVLANSSEAPTSTITVPAAGVFITATDVFAIQGMASTAEGTLEVSTDGGRIWHDQAAALNWTYDWTVPITDGSHILLSRVTDATGMVQSPPGRSRAIVDHTLPEGSLVIDEGAVYANVLTVTLSVEGSDFNDVDAMHFANRGSDYDSWVSFAPTYTWELSGADGIKTVTGQVRDVPGNPSVPFSDTIILDTTGPSCEVLIDDDATYAKSTQVTLTLNSTDTNGVTEMRVRNADGSWTPWQSYGPEMGWNLMGGDGPRTVEAQFRDIVDNPSAVCSDTILLDSTPPTCGLVVNGGATYTTQPTVTLSLSSSDANGVPLMRFSNDGQIWSAWVAYAASYTWRVPPPDGAKTVRAQFQDAAGNLSATCQDVILLDTMPPTGFILIQGGALYTGSPAVGLTLGASDTNGVGQMRFSNDGESWTGWQTYATSAPWELLPGDGSKTVYVQYEDSPGNVGEPFTDTIVLDTTPPGGAIVINDDDAYTRIPTVTLKITATDEIPVAEMRFSHNGLDWTAWEAYTPSRTWVLAGSDGTKTTYVQFRDVVGNISRALGDAIIFDSTAPGCELFIEGGATYATELTVTLNVACSDANPPMQVRYANEGGAWSEWEPYSAVKRWPLDGDDGLRTVYMEAQDAPGNVGEPVSDTIILDTTAPSCILLIDGDEPFATSWNVTLDIACDDANGIDAIRLSDDGTNWGGWRALAARLPWTLPVGDGTKTVYLQARDMPLNETEPVSDTIMLDTTLPSGGCEVMDDNGYVNNPSVLLSLWSYDDNGVPDMQVRDGGTAWEDWIPFATQSPWTLPGGNGEKVVECRFRDTPGNVSSVYSAPMVLDTIPPTCQVEVNGGAEYVIDRIVTLVLNSSDEFGVDDMRFSNDGIQWAPWEAAASSSGWELVPGDGAKRVWVQFRDLAGNVQQCSDDVILDTEPPSGAITLADGAQYTYASMVAVTLEAEDATSGVCDLQLRNAGSAWGAWQAFAENLLWYLGPGTGERTVEVRFRDCAGNVSESVSDSIRVLSILYLPVVVREGP